MDSFFDGGASVNGLSSKFSFDLDYTHTFMSLMCEKNVSIKRENVPCMHDIGSISHLNNRHFVA